MKDTPRMLNHTIIISQGIKSVKDFFEKLSFGFFTDDLHFFTVSLTRMVYNCVIMRIVWKFK